MSQFEKHAAGISVSLTNSSRLVSSVMAIRGFAAVTTELLALKVSLNNRSVDTGLELENSRCPFHGEVFKSHEVDQSTSFRNDFFLRCDTPRLHSSTRPALP